MKTKNGTLKKSREKKDSQVSEIASSLGSVKHENQTIILILYLLGIFMGAIDTGIVTPARTLIQSSLGVDERTGIWLITIYTLAYAAIIPISGKLADRFGRKTIYLISIALFGTGSLIASLSSSVGSFSFLLFGRVVQALGGGGIIPIATAEFGTTFPAEKRGMALGLVGGVYGIANILGSSLGSAILDIFGKSRWNLLFLINVPIAIAIVIFGLLALPNNKGKASRRIDWAGIPVLSAMVLSLLYGLRNIDFFNFASSVVTTQVYPFLIAFAILLPVFIAIERKAEDPVLALEYFTNPATLITLSLSFVVGVMMMGMVFVPQFAENALSIASGSGGYFVAILGIFAGISSPLSGSLIDKFGPKKILSAGFAITLVGAAFLIFYTIPNSGVAAVLVSLGLIGLGLGFTMGTPLNYMMLQNTSRENSNSALATLSLVRSIGTAIAPAIMVGFLAHAGMAAQKDLLALMPPPSSPTFKNYSLLQSQIAELKAIPSLSPMLGLLQLPSFDSPSIPSSISSMSVGSSTSGGLPPTLIAKIQGADVTTITDILKEIAGTMYRQNTSKAITGMHEGIAKGIAGLDQALAATGMRIAQGKLVTLKNTMSSLNSEIDPAFAASATDYANSIENLRPRIESTFKAALNSGFRQMYLTVAVAAILGSILLMLYSSPKRIEEDDKAMTRTI
jgi:EmrB/QacA subfamily drug resistance transporter